MLTKAHSIGFGRLRRVLSIVVMSAILGGCVFAPSKFGPRGVVPQGCGQYEDYLANCCRLSPQLNEVCHARGNPEAVMIGHSGGIFLWRQPLLMLKVGSFGSTSVVRRVPRQLAPHALTASSQAVARRASAPVRTAAPTTAAAVAKTPSVQVLSLEYRPDTRKGIMVVRFAEGCYEAARSYARRNIETLARDKNVALRTGEIPSAANFYLGAERVRENNTLEIEFETE